MEGIAGHKVGHGGDTREHYAALEAFAREHFDVAGVPFRWSSQDNMPADGEIFLITSEGKAKRVEQKEFPVQGRYGRGVIAWDLSEKVRLAGVVVDKPNHMATIHLTKGAPKSTRLDEASIRKRAATKGDAIVDIL